MAIKFITSPAARAGHVQKNCTTCKNNKQQKPTKLQSRAYYAVGWSFSTTFVGAAIDFSCSAYRRGFLGGTPPTGHALPGGLSFCLVKKKQKYDLRASPLRTPKGKGE